MFSHHTVDLCLLKSPSKDTTNTRSSESVDLFFPHVPTPGKLPAEWRGKSVRRDLQLGSHIVRQAKLKCSQLQWHTRYSGSVGAPGLSRPVGIRSAVQLAHAVPRGEWFALLSPQYFQD